MKLVDDVMDAQLGNTPGIGARRLGISSHDLQVADVADSRTSLYRYPGRFLVHKI